MPHRNRLFATGAVPVNYIAGVLLLLIGQSGYAGSPLECVEAALDVAGTSPSSVVYDIGSGDGRVVVFAAKKYKCRTVGIEFDKNLAELSKETARRNKVSIEIRCEDAFKSDLSKATVIYLYHQAEFLKKLKPQLKTGVIVVCLDCPLPWLNEKPVRVIKVDEHEHSIYRYMIK
jgi:ribosomal protein L11 methylase PrmA